MPRTPKRTPRTGSLLLGQELRRLRGGRRLRDICELTRSPQLAADERDQLFEACFRMFLHLRDARPGMATTHLRRCTELFPLVSSQSRWVRQFEAFQRTSP